MIHAKWETIVTETSIELIIRFYAVIKQQKSIFSRDDVDHPLSRFRLSSFRNMRKAPSQVATTVSCLRIYLRLINKRRQASIRK